MAKENAINNREEELYDDLTESFDLDELEEKLQLQFEEELSDLEFLKEEKEKIGNPDNLGNVIMDVVWEQFLNQVAVTAGEDFIEANRGLTLDLRTEAHVQSVDNFEKQKYATHNTYVDYEARGEEYRSNFYTDPNVKPNAKQKQEQRYNEETKVWETYDNVDGEWKKTLKSDYRKPYEEDRNKDKKNKYGSKTINKDHQVADATIARDAEAGAYMTTDEKVSAANSEDNLYDLDSAANQSKSDHDGEKWVKHKRTGKNGNGQTNGEYFGIDEEKYIEQDKKAKDTYEEKKKKKREEEIALGKKSQKEEAFRIGGKALQAVLMQLLAEFVREIIAKLVKWFKSAEKALDTLLDSLKEAIHSFIGKMKTHLINAGKTVFTTVATAIIGPIFDTIKKVWMLFKQGWSSLKNAVQYIKDPANKGKPVGILLMEVGKIIITGLTGSSALILGEVIEKKLMLIPIFAIEIPLLGSLANILGIFLGAVVAGIIGAIGINLIDKLIAKKQKSDAQEAIIEKGNKILSVQGQQKNVAEARLENDKANVKANVLNRHQEAGKIMEESFANIMEDFDVIPSNDEDVFAIDEEDIKTNKAIDEISDDLDKLLANL